MIKPDKNYQYVKIKLDLHNPLLNLKESDISCKIRNTDNFERYKLLLISCNLGYQIIKFITWPIMALHNTIKLKRSLSHDYHRFH